ncbi:MAG: NUDIX domain-containing protein [Candidatus Heimdallarchaeota archaeon]|nr:MAG: NUDIX domain-containing protein [Candidatus Heimdallarchaeota archaeon]
MNTKQKSNTDFDEISCGGVPVYFKRSLKKNIEPLYLLVQHRGPLHYWAFPKGRQSQGESYEQTAIREIREETGQTNFKIMKRLISDSIYFPKRGPRTIVKKVVFFLVRFFSKEIKLSTEHINWCWATFEEALSLLTFDDYQRVLKESHELLMTEIEII